MVGINNSLSGTAVSEAYSNSRNLEKTGISIATGQKVTGVIENLIGSALNDDVCMSQTFSKNAANTVNMLTEAEVSLATTETLARDALVLIEQAGMASPDCVARLETQLNDKKAQMNHLIDNCQFDGRPLLGGEITNVSVQLGKAGEKPINIHIKNIDHGKLFRSSVANTLDDYLQDKFGGGQQENSHYDRRAQIDKDVANNMNLVETSEMKHPLISPGTRQIMSWSQLFHMYHGACHVPGDDGRQFAEKLNVVLPKALKVLKEGCAAIPSPVAGEPNLVDALAADPTRDFTNATTAAIKSAFQKTFKGHQQYSDELARAVYDNQELALSSEADIEISADIFRGVLETAREMRIGIKAQKSNIINIADSISVNTNINQKVADSYSKTDYISATQKYSEEIKKMSVSPAVLQGVNKLNQAVQKFANSVMV